MISKRHARSVSKTMQQFSGLTGSYREPCASDPILDSSLVSLGTQYSSLTGAEFSLSLNRRSQIEGCQVQEDVEVAANVAVRNVDAEISAIGKGGIMRSLRMCVVRRANLTIALHHHQGDNHAQYQSSNFVKAHPSRTCNRKMSLFAGSSDGFCRATESEMPRFPSRPSWPRV